MVLLIEQRVKQQDCVSHGWIIDGFPRTPSQVRSATAPSAHVIGVHVQSTPSAGELTPSAGELTPSVGTLTPSVGELTPSVGKLTGGAAEGEGHFAGQGDLLGVPLRGAVRPRAGPPAGPGDGAGVPREAGGDGAQGPAPPQEGGAHGAVVQ
eukprot:1195177-Prorocentrum_minimum.AAC.5